MGEYDSVIRGGTIVDGSGSLPAFKADLAIKDGKIAKISGHIKGGKKELDASGCIVAPGAVDLHTHYEAQLNWEPYCTMSGWHGVTSVTIGQCGFGFAPCKPEDRDAAMRLMTRIEAIPYETMVAGLRWDWVTFPDWLNSLDQPGRLGVNVGSLVPFNPLRLYVMGIEASRTKVDASPKELNQMKAIFHQAMKAGAFGWSAMKTLANRPEDGRFIPSQVASNEEFLALAEVMREFGVGHIGWTRGPAERPIPPGEVDFMSGAQGLASATGILVDAVEGDVRGDERDAFLMHLVATSGRPLQYGAVTYNEQRPGRYKEQLALLEQAHAKGLPLYAQTTAFSPAPRFQLDEYNGFDVMPNWIDAFVGTPAQRAAKLRKPEVRARLKQDLREYEAEAAAGAQGSDWSKIKVLEVRQERNHKYEGLTVTQIAQMTGKHPVDAMLDLALDEDLLTEFEMSPATGTDHKAAAEIINHPYTHLSVSDGGAHVRYLTLGTWPVYFLSTWVRDRQIMSLEKAHYKMSALPAWIAGFTDRGMLREGLAADVIVYDQDRLGFLYDKPVYANDFPDDGRRLIQKARGIRYTVVNGEVTFEESSCTGATPGKLLRSYDMVK